MSLGDLSFLLDRRIKCEKGLWGALGWVLGAEGKSEKSSRRPTAEAPARARAPTTPLGRAGSQANFCTGKEIKGGEGLRLALSRSSLAFPTPDSSPSLPSVLLTPRTHTHPFRMSLFRRSSAAVVSAATASTSRSRSLPITSCDLLQKNQRSQLPAATAASFSTSLAQAYPRTGPTVAQPKLASLSAEPNARVRRPTTTVEFEEPSADATVNGVDAEAAALGQQADARAAVELRVELPAEMDETQAVKFESMLSRHKIQKYNKTHVFVRVLPSLPPLRPPEGKLVLIRQPTSGTAADSAGTFPTVSTTARWYRPLRGPAYPFSTLASSPTLEETAASSRAATAGSRSGTRRTCGTRSGSTG